MNDNNNGNRPSGKKRYNNNRRRKRPADQEEKSNSYSDFRNNSKKRFQANDNSDKRRPNPRNNNRKKPGIEAIFRKYDNLVDMHIGAKRKLFEFFHRADRAQKAKFERNYDSTLENIKKFENSLTDYQKVRLETRFGSVKPDTTFSDNHSLDPNGTVEESDNTTPFDPHYLESQRNHAFKNDTEESVGTMEDYNRIKPA